MTFEYKGISSSDFDIIVEAISRPVHPAARPRMAEIYGKSGVIDYGSDEYDSIQIALQIAYVGNDAIELQQRNREISAWINSTKFEKLIIGDETDKYYQARVLEGVNLTTLNRLGRTEIVFECQPFAYMVVDTGLDPTWDEADFPWIIEMPWAMGNNYIFNVSGTGSSFNFDNPGTALINYKSPQDSKSNIKVVGSWGTFEVSLNGKTLIFPTGTGEILIDNIDMTVTLNGANSLSLVGGDIDSFLPIVPGQNIININGTDINATVTLEFRPQWV